MQRSMELLWLVIELLNIPKLMEIALFLFKIRFNLLEYSVYAWCLNFEFSSIVD